MIAFATFCVRRGSPRSRTYGPPRSRVTRHSSMRTNLCSSLRRDGIAYVSLGKELGGRPASRKLFRDDVADYEAMAATHEFQEGMNRVADGAHRYRIALMCSEQDPLDCHRCLLIGRALSEQGVQVNHLLADGRMMSHPDIEQEFCG